LIQPGGNIQILNALMKKGRQMIRMFVRHKVNDYAAWRKAYDDFDATRNSMGVKGHAVYQAAGDPNDVTAWHDFDSLEKAQAFAGSNELREAMGSAGVASPPDIWFTTPA
jgi:hypothetical protein